MLAKVTYHCQKLEEEFSLINDERKSQLTLLSNYITQKKQEEDNVKITVICTHNSRRSHMGQIWLGIAADFYNVSAVETFSGGTEATAFNINAVNAFKNIGVDITSEDDSDNPTYNVKWQADMAAYQAFSKQYDKAPNPTEKFAAIMVCNHADVNCPVVIGCDFRLALPFDDPKAFDNTELQALKYEERCNQIGRQMLFAMSKVHQ